MGSVGGKRVMILCGPDKICLVESALKSAGAEVERTFDLIGGLCARVTPDALMKLLAANPDLHVLPDTRLHLPPRPLQPEADMGPRAGGAGVPAATGPAQPGVAPAALAIMQVEAARALGMDGTGVRLAIIDSGVDFGHPDLAGTAATDAEGRMLAADFTGTDLTDTLGHGTGVAGNIASQGRQVYQVGEPGLPPVYHKIIGIAPGVKLLSAKVFDTRVPGGGGWESSIIAAMEWAVKNGAHILNLSLGGASVPNNGRDAIAVAAAAIRQRGVAVFCAAGNEGSGDGSIAAPGSGAASITVGASTAYRSFGEIGYLAAPGKYGDDQVAGFSSRGPTTDGRLKPDFCAPGAFDWSLAPAAGSEYGTLFQLFGGTSQATPMAAAVAALVWQAFQKARGRAPTPEELQRILAATADDLGYPGSTQGAGRLNAGRAVAAALGRGGAPLLEAVEGQHGLTAAGGTRTVTVRLHNPGGEPLPVACRVSTLQPDSGSHWLVGRLTSSLRSQEIPVEVPGGVDLLHLHLSWTGTPGTGAAPRAAIALYDPDGNFINYHRPASMGEPELGRMVETWAARPRPGTWTARVILRPAGYSGDLPYSLGIRFLQRQPWPWAQVPEGLTIPAGQPATVTCQVAVPPGAAAGWHEARLEFAAGGRTLVVPLAVNVPVAVAEGGGSFSGQFRHGLQGYWQSGDWRTFPFRVPAGVATLSASVHWPDAGNALRAYLIDPDGNAVLGKAGTDPAGSSGTLGHELVWTRPKAGWWQLILHAVAFSGRSEPEPFSGQIRFAPDLAEPRELKLVATPGARVPVALGVRNPGRVPMAVLVRARTPAVQVRTEEFTAITETGLDPQGKGSGVKEIGPFAVPPGARLLAAYVMWDRPGVEVAVSLADPVTGSTQAFASGREGLVLAMERHPAPGNWTLVLSSKAPGNPSTLELRGGWILQAPQDLTHLVSGDPAVLLPGATALVTGWLQAPANLKEPLRAELLVVTADGDQVAAVPARLHPAGALEPAPAGMPPAAVPSGAAASPGAAVTPAAPAAAPRPAAGGRARRRGRRQTA